MQCAKQAARTWLGIDENVMRVYVIYHERKSWLGGFDALNRWIDFSFV